MLLRRLETIISQAGGVPTHLRIDNLSAAVVTVGKGDNETLIRIILQISKCINNFEVQPCNLIVIMKRKRWTKSLLYTKLIGLRPPDYGEFFRNSHSGLEVQAMEDQKTPTLWERSQWLKTFGMMIRLALKGHYLLEDLTVLLIGVDTTTVNKYGEISSGSRMFCFT